jgi:hypothetical protein
MTLSDCNGDGEGAGFFAMLLGWAAPSILEASSCWIDCLSLDASALALVAAAADSVAYGKGWMRAR